MVLRYILIIKCSSVVVMMVTMMCKWIFENMPVITYPQNSCESRAPSDPPRHHDRATPAPHISRRVPGERIPANARVDERGALRGALPGTERSLPGNGADRRERRGSQHLRRPFPPEVAPSLTSRQHFRTQFNIKIRLSTLYYTSITLAENIRSVTSSY